MKPFYRSTLATLLWGTSAFFAPLLMATTLASAQSDPPVCPPPGDQEYLLLVRGEDEAERSDIASILPVESSVIICRYLDEVLVRAGGFTQLETVNAWASYMSSEADYESFVIRPGDQINDQTVASGSTSPETVPETTTAPVIETEPETEPETESETAPEATAPIETEPETAPEATVSPEATETQSAAAPITPTFEPTRLETGYAVLVDYSSNPEIAETLSQLVSSVGLAVYQQRPYLLASYSESEDTAATTLQELSNAQLAAVVVDAQEVVQISKSVVISNN
ncbi:hypothetical protein S7335_2644 [Synechococcus sp. PCC 7335]|uniref:hypothetical protein n=1 Tax=Synechococcus sp. (strain ATCC 29403 / PCC 7335) TaxID=91464 RepID=UPI00017EB0A2|nr:hypothetical protein [Synechococcus sp. PCC 7335]EDX84945.1 hypothetical protein S7335_2644 [Synechococcus sp. PCC 7335]